MFGFEAIKALVLGVIEGFTEFLPVSSTGHLLLFGHFFGFESKGKTFEVLVQLGAILAILIVYFRKLLDIALDALEDAAVMGVDVAAARQVFLDEIAALKPRFVGNTGQDETASAARLAGAAPKPAES